FSTVSVACTSLIRLVTISPNCGVGRGHPEPDVQEIASAHKASTRRNGVRIVPPGSNVESIIPVAPPAPDNLVYASNIDYSFIVKYNEATTLLRRWPWFVFHSITRVRVC